MTKKKRNYKDKIPGGIGDTIAKAIAKKNLTNYRISKDTGVDQATLSRFFGGSRAMSLLTAEKLAEYLGFSLQPISVRPKDQ